MQLTATPKEATLNWIREPVDELVQNLQLGLEAIAQQNKDRPSREDIKHILAQLQFTFMTLELQGPASLCEEIQHIVPAFEDPDKDKRETALTSAMEATVVLPSYLDRIQAGQTPMPILLLPIMNELRATRHAQPLSEGALFSPPLDVELPKHLQNLEQTPASPADFKRVRQQFQSALLNWFQDQDQLSLLEPLRTIAEGMALKSRDAHDKRLWWVTQAVFCGLGEQTVENSLSLKRLFARLDVQLKALAEEAIEDSNESEIKALTKALLFHLAMADPGTETIEEIRHAFQLQKLIPDPQVLRTMRGAVIGQNRELYESLGKAVKDELAQIKDVLDLELRTKEYDAQRHAQAISGMQALADTLKMLELNTPATEIERIAGLLKQGGSEDADEQVREKSLYKLAEELLKVEAILDEHINTLGRPKAVAESAQEALIDLPAYEISQIRTRVYDESLQALRKVQNAMVTGASDDQQRPDAVNTIEHQLGLISGALNLLRKPQISSYAQQLTQLMPSVFEDTEKLELTAEAITALELYLANSRDNNSDENYWIGILSERLSGLTSEPEVTATETPEEEAPTAVPVETSGTEVDTELAEIFLEEFATAETALQELLPRWPEETDNTELVEDIRRAFHTLKGSGRMVGANEIGDFSAGYEQLLDQIKEGKQAWSEDIQKLVTLGIGILPQLRGHFQGDLSQYDQDGIIKLQQAVEQAGQGQPIDWAGLEVEERISEVVEAEVSLPEEIEAEAEVEQETATTIDPKLTELIINDINKHLPTLQEFVTSAKAIQSRAVAGDAPIRAAHTLASSLALAPVGNESNSVRQLEYLLQTSQKLNRPISTASVDLVESTILLIQTRLETLQDNTASDYDFTDNRLADELVKATKQLEVGDQDAAESHPDTQHGELVQIFLDEAAELLDRTDEFLVQWRNNLDDLKPVNGLRRELHTLKGGARMAGLLNIGDLGHAMESILEEVGEGNRSADLPLVKLFESGCDRIHDAVAAIAAGQTEHTQNLVQRFEAQLAQLATGDTVSAIDSLPEDVRELDDAPIETTEISSGGNVRVAAKTLDELINQAGEISIYRSRIDQQLNTLKFNLAEVDETVKRLRSQLRKMEIETEAQILSRYQREDIEQKRDFDPLELDRFSTIQQLSRALSESVSDLLNLHKMMDDTTRHSETLLLQQSRVNNELQESLMQTRMVPFASIATRLRRVVRGAAADTKKEAHLRLQAAGSGDQLDRNVLERITAPLEHLLRNAIAHGIETPAQRKAAKKKAEGLITVTVESEATEFIIHVEDDGAGIDFDKVRARAIERKLVEADAEPTQEKLLQLMMQSGFSTSQEVSKLAGRGVGLDVVQNTIKQIGGSLEIHSNAGQGTRFTIHIPFTLAVMQAMTVLVNERQYMIPLANVRGVSRMSRDDYVNLQQQSEPQFEFAGENYPLTPLNPLLEQDIIPSNNPMVTLLMVQAGEQRAALLVDRLLGHREIVVKPVGPQVSSVPGILAATITGDGSVVLILDIGPLVRFGPDSSARLAVEEPEQVRQPLIMVVDDSITIRKVTARALENHEFEVVTAKDGLDAIEQMHERIPDLMLLDIEMPRMDGFELAAYIRAEQSLEHIPIIMITSRSGKKHRDHAAEVGVNAYLAKPYQENDLIKNVNQLLTEAADDSDDS